MNAHFRCVTSAELPAKLSAVFYNLFEYSF